MRIIAILLGPLLQLMRLAARGCARHWDFSLPATVGAVACAWFGRAAQGLGINAPCLPLIWGILGGYWIGLAGRSVLAGILGERRDGDRHTRHGGDRQA